MRLLWIIVPIVIALIMVSYLYRKIWNLIYCFASNWAVKKQRILLLVLCAICVAPAFFAFYFWFIVVFHIEVFLLILDFIHWVVRKIRGGKPDSKVWHKIYSSGIIAIVLTAIVCGYGAYNITNIVKHEYTIETTKAIRPEGYKILFLADIHYGTATDDASMQAFVDTANAENADFILLGGDIVDENTTYDQMKSVFSILSGLKSNYGTYYVYGNHDKCYGFSSPNFTIEELTQTIIDSGITIMEDDVVTINDDVTVIGRVDRGDLLIQRKDLATLLEGVDTTNELIILDHQPHYFEDADANGIDMFLAGHTHAGQIWPFGLIFDLSGVNDCIYGYKLQGNLQAIVTSGISGWGFPIRTEEHSEYVIINLVPSAQ